VCSGVLPNVPYFNMDLGFPKVFEFKIFISRAPNISNMIDLIIPADELFYKGQLLPLHLPSRIDMVQNLVSLIGFESSSTSYYVNSESFWRKDSTNYDSSCNTSNNGISKDSTRSL
jgi:hypothetical protein